MLRTIHPMFNAACRSFLGALLLWSIASPCLAEEPDPSQDNTDTQGWLQYQVQHRYSEKTRGSWAVGYRELLSTEPLTGDWRRLHARAEVLYDRSGLLTFEGGLGLYYTFQDIPGDQWEARTWIGAILFWPTITVAKRRFEFAHRFRLEQRWLQGVDLDGSDFGLRGRYRISTVVPLNQPTVDIGSVYLPLMGEWFFDEHDALEEHFAARIRVTTGVGWVSSKNWTFELRYTAQRSRDTVTDSFSTTDHIIDLRIRTTLRIQDLGRTN